MNDIEERLTRTFKTVAEQTTTESDWNGVVGDAESAAVASSPLRPRVLAIAAMLAIVVGAGAFVLNQDSSNEVDATQLSPFVLPGEEVLSLDPLTVRPAPTPAARFDTSNLGTEVVVEPLTELDWETERFIEFQTNTREGASITKLTFLGVVDGSAYVQLVTDGPDQFGNTNGNVRHVYVIGGGGGSGGGNAADADSTDFLIPSGGGMNWSAGSDGRVIWEVPPGTAAVGFTSGDSSLWTRPSGGYAIFPTDLDNGEQFALQAFDVNGDVVLEESRIVHFNPEAAIGDPFNLAGTTDLAGSPFTIEPDGNPVVFLVGSQTCEECQLVADRGLELVAALDPGVRLFLVPPFDAPNEMWPLDATWTQQRIRLDDPGRLWQNPGILVLDGEGIVVSYEVGVDDVLEALASVNDLVDN